MSSHKAQLWKSISQVSAEEPWTARAGAHRSLLSAGRLWGGIHKVFRRLHCPLMCSADMFMLHMSTGSSGSRKREMKPPKGNSESMSIYFLKRQPAMKSGISGLSELINTPLIPFDGCHLSTGPQMAKCRERSQCQCHSQAGAQSLPALLAPAPLFKYMPEECKLKTLKKIFCNQKAIFNLNWPEHSTWSVILSRQMLYARTLSPSQLCCSAQSHSAALLPKLTESPSQQGKWPSSHGTPCNFLVTTESQIGLGWKEP